MLAYLIRRVLATIPVMAIVALFVFSLLYLAPGDPAPGWLHEGAVDAWGYPREATALTLITVSENATFLVRVHGSPAAVLRVARPGYMAGTAAFESEVAWVDAIASARVARVRGLPEAQVRALVEARTEQPLLGLLGEPRVNVLALNRALNGLGGTR